MKPSVKVDKTSSNSHQMDTSVNNRLIAKNTLLLYFRMFFQLSIAFYTSRVVLSVLGVTDFGIYNVVGGLVTMFSFMNGALVTSTQRYLTFYLGNGDFDKLAKVFTACIQIHGIISLVVLLVAETFGLWFMYTQMVIPSDRFHAALWVFQLSLLTLLVQIMSVPYNSVIVAHEQMGVFAYISIVDVLLKLLSVYMILLGNFDKLIFYAILIALEQLFIRFIYTRYCLKHFSECHIQYIWHPKLLREIGSFAGWNLWGNLAGTLFGTGLNLLLNVFFGPAVNAARGIAHQVEAGLTQFSSNFLMAVNPQITKTYAKSDFKELHNLLFRSCKFSYFLIMVFALPIMFEAEPILILWLKTPPDYTAIFLRLMLSVILLDTLARPLMTAAAATGNVKLYQSVVGGILLMIVPIAYIVLNLGAPPASIYVVHFIMTIVASIARLIIIRPMIKLSIKEYINKTIVPVVAVTFVSLVVPVLLKYNLSESVFSQVVVALSSFICACISTYGLGLSSSEQKFLKEKLYLLFSHHKLRD